MDKYAAGVFEETALEDIKIPSTVTCMNDRTFYRCKNLTTVDIPDEFKYVGHNCFFGTKMTEITVPAALKAAGVMAFHNGQTPLVVIRKEHTAPGATRVGRQTLAQLWNAREVVLPDGLKTIGDRWFSEKSIETIMIPASVKRIGIQAFCHCRRLRRVTFAAKSGLMSIADSCFVGSGLGEFCAPSKLKEIGCQAFGKCEKLASVVLNEGLKAIGRGAFLYSGLKSALIPSSVRKLGSMKAGRGGFSEAQLEEASTQIGAKCFVGAVEDADAI